MAPFGNLSSQTDVMNFRGGLVEFGLEDRGNGGVCVKLSYVDGGILDKEGFLDVGEKGFFSIDPQKTIGADPAVLDVLRYVAVHLNVIVLKGSKVEE